MCLAPFYISYACNHRCVSCGTILDTRCILTGVRYSTTVNHMFTLQGIYAFLCVWHRFYISYACNHRCVTCCTVLDSRCILTGVRYAYDHRCGSWGIVLDSRCILTGVRCCATVHHMVIDYTHRDSTFVLYSHAYHECMFQPQPFRFKHKVSCR